MILNRRAFLAGSALTALAACAAEPAWAPDAAVDAVAYRGPAPRSLTLYTMRKIDTGSGEHTGLLVDASQRVMFDPAGTFGHSTIPERNDVLFGFSPQVEAYYVSYHARVTHYVIGQKIIVSDDLAEAALRAVLTNGAVPKAQCARATSGLLRRLPGFETIPQTWYPNTLASAFGALPGVVTREYREDDPDNKSLAARQIDMQITAAR